MSVKVGFAGVELRSVERYDLVENQTDVAGSRTLMLLMTPPLTIKWKLHCRSRIQKRKKNNYNVQFRAFRLVVSSASARFRLRQPRQPSFHWIRSDGVIKSKSESQLRSAERYDLVENQTDGVGSRTLMLLMTPPLTIKWKLHCRSLNQKRKNKPITMFNSGPFDWLVLPLLLPSPTTQTT